MLSKIFNGSYKYVFIYYMRKYENISKETIIVFTKLIMILINMTVINFLKYRVSFSPWRSRYEVCRNVSHSYYIIIYILMNENLWFSQNLTIQTKVWVDRLTTSISNFDRLYTATVYKIFNIQNKLIYTFTSPL